MRALALVFLLFLPASALAEPVVVRSGEHADFSRLAFRFPGPVDWEMGRVETGYEIRLKDSDSVLDVSDVYQRISHDRIGRIQVSPDSSSVVLTLSCDCYADAFEFRPGLLVVDIKEGVPPQTSLFEKRFTADETALTPHSGSVQIPAPVAETAAIKPPRPAPPKMSVSLPLLTQKPAQHSAPSVGVFASPASEDAIAMQNAAKESERIAEMQSEMLAQISRAASQGLLQADVELPQPIMELSREAAEKPTDTSAPPLAESVQEHLNIHVETSIDRDVGSGASAGLLTQNGAECLQSKLFHIATWGNPDAVATQITLQRTGVVGEFDKVDPKAVKKLVQAYIYAGFGAEAQAALQAFDAGLEYADVLNAMAQIVDGGFAVPGSRLDFQSGCDTAVALWSVLAAPELSKSMEINRKSVLAAFSDLPLHQRRNLGPKLSQKFLDIDDRQTATALRNAIARAIGDAGPEFRLLDARLDQQRGMHDAAEEALEIIVSEDSAIAPEALITLLRAKLERNTEIEAELIASAEILIFTQQGTKTSADLQYLIAQARGRSGHYPAAIKALRAMAGSEFIDTKERGRAWANVLSNALEDSDSAFLRFVFAAQDDFDRQPIPREIRRNAASRLLESGFSDIAIRILAAPTRPTTNDRLILARAAVLDHLPEGALRWAANVAGEEAATIRAQALELSGNLARAAEEYGAIPDQARQQNTYWRAGDWQQLERVENQPVQEAAQIMLLQQSGVAESIPEITGIIAQDQHLLETSKATRASIEAILKSFPPLLQEGS